MILIKRARYAAYLALGATQTAEIDARRDGRPRKADKIAAIRDTLRGVVVELESLTQSGGLAFSQPLQDSSSPVRRQSERGLNV